MKWYKYLTGLMLVIVVYLGLLSPILINQTWKPVVAVLLFLPYLITL